MTLRNCLLTLTLFSLGSMAIAQAPDKNPPRTLVIIGASYAKEWEQPMLKGFTVINKGVGGEESSAVLARFQRDALSPVVPDAVLIWGHYNDVVRAPPEKRGQVGARARSNYLAMIDQARKAGARVMLATEITMPIPDTFAEKMKGKIGDLLGKVDYRKRVNASITEVNTWLRQHAAEQGIPLLDFETALASGNGTRRVEYTRTDGSHVSPAGYAALTAYANGVLAALQWPLRTGSR